MLNVASIVPIPYLEMIKGKPYHMCLAHLAQASVEYADFYSQERAGGSFVLMDNGAAEDSQLSVEELITLVECIEPTEIVLPDVIYDGKATEDRSYRALHQFIRAGVSTHFMAVPQGNTVQEWVDCAREMSTWPIHSLGISKFMTLKLGPYTRFLLLRALADIRPKKEIQLLGCGYDPREIATLYKLFPYIRGTDSAIPYVYAQESEAMLRAVREGIPRSQAPIDFFQAFAPRSILSSNIQVWEDICNGRLL
jgi:hypothetical protein